MDGSKRCLGVLFSLSLLPHIPCFLPLTPPFTRPRFAPPSPSLASASLSSSSDAPAASSGSHSSSQLHAQLYTSRGLPPTPPSAARVCGSLGATLLQQPATTPASSLSRAAHLSAPFSLSSTLIPYFPPLIPLFYEGCRAPGPRPHHKPFGLARTGRGLRALDLVGAAPDARNVARSGRGRSRLTQLGRARTGR